MSSKKLLFSIETNEDPSVVLGAIRKALPDVTSVSLLQQRDVVQRPQTAGEALIFYEGLPGAAKEILSAAILASQARYSRLNAREPTRPTGTVGKGRGTKGVPKTVKPEIPAPSAEAQSTSGAVAKSGNPRKAVTAKPPQAPIRSGPEQQIATQIAGVQRKLRSLATEIDSRSGEKFSELPSDRKAKFAFIGTEKARYLKLSDQLESLLFTKHKYVHERLPNGGPCSNAFCRLNQPSPTGSVGLGARARSRHSSGDS